MSRVERQEFATVANQIVSARSGRSADGVMTGTDATQWMAGQGG